jgi:hypothetical protein
MRKSFAALAVAALIVLAVPAAANAVSGGNVGSEVVTPTPTPTPTDYTPPQPPSLTGSTLAPVCADGVPWINYHVVLTDPDGQSTGTIATLILSDGTNTYSQELGDLSDSNPLSGQILWPGASVDPVTGEGNGWPGWAFENGQWVETTGNFAWTRQPITAIIDVNPQIQVSLSYPPATPNCTDPPSGGGNLPATGLNAAVVWPIGIAGAVLVLAGVTFVVLRRRALS